MADQAGWEPEEVRQLVQQLVDVFALTCCCCCCCWLRWSVPAAAGPAEGDPHAPSTQLWAYRSTVDPIRDTQVGSGQGRAAVQGATTQRVTHQ
jgi:hypothetical protein